MNWFEAKISTEPQAVDAVTGILLELGITGFVIEDPADFNDFLTSTEYRWDYIDEDLMQKKEGGTFITVYLAENEQGKSTLLKMHEAFEAAKQQSTDISFGSLEIELKNVKEEDWANNWKQYFKPFAVGEKLFIKPTWESAENAGDRCVLNIDPGSSFGTGQHYTTKLCLEQLEKAIKGNEKVLDLGCGSGILSIGALLLGAKSAVGIDIDQNSVCIAIENAAENNIADTDFTARCGNIIDDTELRDWIGGGYDILVANIVADVIIAMAPLFRQFMQPDALLITSGIIHRQRDEVVEALQKNGFEILHAEEQNDWSCIVSKIA